jgi:hypothetical protein
VSLNFLGRKTLIPYEVEKEKKEKKKPTQPIMKTKKRARRHLKNVCL